MGALPKDRHSAGAGPIVSSVQDVQLLVYNSHEELLGEVKANIKTTRNE